MDKLDVSIVNMRSFVRVAERGNLSAVARELGLGQSTISRHLQELEDAIGVPLLSRTTRRVTLTTEGSLYYANCVQILRLIEQAGDEARGTRGAASGTIRISCTAAFGILHITRLVFAFQDRYPDIAIDLNLTDERIDLVREGVDIALRLAPLTDSSMKLRALGHSHRLLVAAPGYLAGRGTPRVPQDLLGHDGIRMPNVAGSDVLALMSGDGQRHEVPFSGRFRTNHGPRGARSRAGRARHRRSPCLAGRRSHHRGQADGAPARLQAAVGAAQHADRPGARRHRARPAGDRRPGGGNRQSAWDSAGALSYSRGIVSGRTSRACAASRIAALAAPKPW